MSSIDSARELRELRELHRLAPRVLGALVRRYGDFGGAEDAVQEALISASVGWTAEGRPADPLAWLVRVASRRLANEYRASDARQRREELAASWSIHQPASPAPGRDDTLIVMLLCCHPALSPSAAIPLTLRAVGGLTTREIATAFVVPEATMAQRISRAKAKLRDLDAPFEMPGPSAWRERLASMLRVLYLVFNEGYAASVGPQLDRPDLAAEAVRLAGLLVDQLPGEPEVHGLLGLMLLSEARRPARAASDGSLVALSSQDRSLWSPDLIRSGLTHAVAAIGTGSAGQYGLQAAIQALHASAPSYASTRWDEIVVLYERLESLTGNPVVRINRAVAVAVVKGPAAGLALLADLDGRLRGHYRLASVRAHLYEMLGDPEAAVSSYRAAAGGTHNLRERDYLLVQAARVSTYGCRGVEEFVGPVIKRETATPSP